MQTKFVVSKTKEATKLNVLVYINPTDVNDYFVLHRYRKQDNTIEENWLNPLGEVLDYVPNVGLYTVIRGL